MQRINSLIMSTYPQPIHNTYPHSPLSMNVIRTVSPIHNEIEGNNNILYTIMHIIDIIPILLILTRIMVKAVILIVIILIVIMYISIRIKNLPIIKRREHNSDIHHSKGSSYGGSI